MRHLVFKIWTKTPFNNSRSIANVKYNSCHNSSPRTKKVKVIFYFIFFFKILFSSSVTLGLVGSLPLPKQLVNYVH